MAKKKESVAETPKRGRKPGQVTKPLTDQDKVMNFKTKASKRVIQLIRSIRFLGKLSSPRSNIYTKEQVEKVFADLQRELDAAKARYDFSADGGKKKSDITYEL